MALYATACPAAGLLMLTAPPEFYLVGDLIGPLYCSHESCLSALVPYGTGAGAYGVRAYLEGLAKFHATFRGQLDEHYSSAYDKNAETEILAAYTRTVVSDDLTSSLLVEVIRAGLPSSDDALRFEAGNNRATFPDFQEIFNNFVDIQK
jgi:hypothetical protein